MMSNKLKFSTALGFSSLFYYRQKMVAKAEGRTPYFSTACRYNPHFEKIRKNGEDAHIVSKD